MPPIKVIANPTAGHGKAARLIPDLERELTTLGLDYELVRTERAGHGREIARQAARDGYAVVVAAGGDGTMNEVLNGLMAARAESPNRPALGVICLGRGNDFAACVDIPADLPSACRALQADQRRTIDIGRITGGDYPQGRYFANNAGMGFDAIGTIEVVKLPEWGMLSFMIAILKTIVLYYKGPTVRIDYDDQSLETSTLMVLTMNGKRMGTGFQMAPDSQPDDGLFDVVIVRQVSRGRILTLIPHFIQGTQGSQPELRTLQAARVTITALEGVLPSQADGEIICVAGKQLTMEVLPRQIEVICPMPDPA
ncbi:MAG: diacylglycerol kinase family lipid kinase [Anaerolineales bacterium]|nr:diacylglycerol kinase family lipid kinase [Anaerolineales bacterium]